MPHCFVVFGKVQVLVYFFRFLSFSPCDLLERQKPIRGIFFLVNQCTVWSSGRKKGICFFFFFFFFISKSFKILCIPFSRTKSGLCIYHLVEWSNFNFVHNSLWITFPTQSCLVLISFCAFIIIIIIIIWFLTLLSVCYNSLSGVSSWCNGLRNRSNRVRTPVARLRSLSDKYHWKKYEPPYLPGYGLNSTTTILLEG